MVYIQSNENRKLPHHFDAMCAMFGAEHSGLEFRLTSFNEVASGKFDMVIKNNLFVGSIEFMNEVFSRINKFPSNIKPSNRDYQILTLKQAIDKTKDGENKLFIKPLNKLKRFSGLILDGTIQSILLDIPDNFKVIAYEVLPPILSEWRGYVHMNKLVDCRNYSGDFKISPDYDYIKNQIDENKQDFPIAYTIDVGILEDGNNTVIEYNDMWAIGNYGMENELYYRLLKDRYFEIVRA